MAEFSKLVITDKGKALMAKVLAGAGNIAFTKIAVSQAEYTLEELETLEELAEIRQNSPISRISRTNETAVKVETAFVNIALSEGYYMRTLGLYAVDPDEGEILYAAARETSTHCYMPPYNGITTSGAYVQLVTVVGNADNVKIEVAASAIATLEDLQTLQIQITALSDYVDMLAHPFVLSLTLPVSAWTPSSDSVYPYVAEISVDSCKETYYPDIAIHKDSLKTAFDADICGSVQSLDGKLRFWAKSIPSKDLRLSALLVTDGKAPDTAGVLSGGAAYSDGTVTNIVFSKKEEA